MKRLAAVNVPKGAKAKLPTHRQVKGTAAKPKRKGAAPRYIDDETGRPFTPRRKAPKGNAKPKGKAKPKRRKKAGVVVRVYRRRRPTDSFQVGLVLVSPPQQKPPTRARAKRFGLKDARAIVNDPDATSEQLLQAAEFSPRRVLAHPVMAFLSLPEPAAWQRIKLACDSKLIKAQWSSIRGRLSLDDCRRLTLVALRASAPLLDQLVMPQGSDGTARIAHLLEAVLDGDLSRREVHGLLRAGITGGPAVAKVQSADDNDIWKNDRARSAIGSCFELIVGPPKLRAHLQTLIHAGPRHGLVVGARFTRRKARRVKIKGRRSRQRQIRSPKARRQYAPEAAMSDLINIVETDEQWFVLMQAIVTAAHALLAAKSASP